MSLNRSLPRNVSFYDATNPDEVLGGHVQNGSITETNFLDMLGILLVVGVSPIRVQERMSNNILSRTEVPLQVGVYDIYYEASIQVSNEPWVHRLISHKISCREDSFRIDIRNRDRKCVISGIPVPEIFIQSNNWTTFEAAHIFPLRHPSHWVEYNYGRWITDVDDAVGSSKMNSRQNGFLLRNKVHAMFDQYLISVNPDDGYKVVVFDSDLYSYDGKTLDPHFRQSVLANVRGAWERILEHEFPPGADSVGEVLAGPYAPERFGLGIAAGLRVVS
ncbi:HNH endonuclease-domain-containing protein [Tuber brumale]|nr:HNH endonuclease-domain-containing protein [Tuber brumale]